MVKFISLVRIPHWVCVAMLSLPLVVHADVVSRLDGYIVQQSADGQEHFKRASSVEPGETIEYRLSYLNTGDKMVRDLAATGMVPFNTEYLGGTGEANVHSEFRVSIDGGESWDSEPVIRLRTLPDGESEKVIVPPSEYTHLRWYAQEGLAAEQTQVFSYRILVK